VSDILNQTKTFSLIEQRIAKTVRAFYDDTIVKGATLARECRPNRRQSS